VNIRVGGPLPGTAAPSTQSLSLFRFEFGRDYDAASRM